MWHLVKKEHLFIFLAIFTALVVFNSFNFNLNSLVAYDDQTCVNQGYQCCIQGKNAESQYDNSCALNEKCYDSCTQYSSYGINAITGLGLFGFLKESFNEDSITSSTFVDSNPGIDANDLKVDLIDTGNNGVLQVNIDASVELENSEFICRIFYGDGQEYRIEYSQSYKYPANLDFSGGNFALFHWYSAGGLKNIEVPCNGFNPNTGDFVFTITKTVTVSGQAPPASGDTTLPVISLQLQDAYTGAGGSTTNDGIIHAILSANDPQSGIATCQIMIDNNNFISIPSTTTVYTFGSSAQKLSDGTHQVAYRCFNGNNLWDQKTANIAVLSGSPVTTVTGNYFKDGLDGLVKTCRAPGNICSGTTKDNTADVASCANDYQCVFNGQCYNPRSLIDVSAKFVDDFDSSTDKEACVSYFLVSQQDGRQAGAWVDADIGDSGSDGRNYCEVFWPNAKWVSSNVKCEAFQRFGNISLDYCDDTRAGLSTNTVEGVTSNYCCGDDLNENYVTTSGRSACCSSPAATVDQNGNCMVPAPLGNVEIINVTTIPADKAVHYGSLDVFCSISSTDQASSIRNCVQAKIDTNACSFTRLSSNNIVEFRNCNVGGNIGNATVTCSVSDLCRTTSLETKSKSKTIQITAPKICKDGDTEKLALIKRLSVIDVDLDETDFNVGDELSVKVEVGKDSSLRERLDVGVSAIIYDLTVNRIVNEKKVTGIIDSRADSNIFTINLEVLNKEFMDSDDSYRLYIKAYDSKDESSLCVESSSIDLTIDIDDDLGGSIRDANLSVDRDNDGYNENRDCNDNDRLVNPGASEVCNDNIDNNCNGEIDEFCTSIPQPASSDSDNDGMDDDWEIQHFGDLTTANANSDFDKDGTKDVIEFFNNTDPKISGEGSNNTLLVSVIIVLLMIVGVVLYFIIGKKKPKVFNFTKAKNTNELVNYIKRTSQKGYSKQQITKILLSKGWHTDEIEHAFKKTK